MPRPFNLRGAALRLKRTRRAPKKIVIALCAALVFVVALRGIYLLLSGAEARVEGASEVSDYLAELGYTAESPPVEVRDVMIPATFSEAYANYNEMQKAGGFDLSRYKAEKAKIYVFKLSNHPKGASVFANVIVCKGRIIGGDICSYAIDGFMTGLK